MDWPQRIIEVEVWPDMLRVDSVRLMVEQLAAASVAVSPTARARTGRRIAGA